MEQEIRARKVLIVEDNVELRSLSKERLQKEGIEVIEAENGSDGLKLAVMHHPDLILLDNQMPDMGGFEMLKELRSRDNWGAHVPVIFFSNIEPKGADEVEDIQALGPVEYIVKSKTDLGVVVSKILTRLRAHPWEW